MQDLWGIGNGSQPRLLLGLSPTLPPEKELEEVLWEKVGCINLALSGQSKSVHGLGKW